MVWQTQFVLAGFLAWVRLFPAKADARVAFRFFGFLLNSFYTMAFLRRRPARTVAYTLNLGDIEAELTFKAVRTIRISVCPPDGRVRISAPLYADERTVRAFAVSRLDWITRQRERVAGRDSRAPLSFTTGEPVFIWGRRYILEVTERAGRPGIRLDGERALLSVRPGSDAAARAKILEARYRAELNAALPALLAKWEPRLGVKSSGVSFRRMKTRWGSCSVKTDEIRLNLSLAERPPECLEYVLVHELTHLLEPSHNARFKSLLEGFYPGWKTVKAELSRPLS
jgi:predicted metal-dependent hydrolase